MYKGCWDLFCKNVWFFLNKIVYIFGPKIDFLKGIERFDLFRFWNIIIDSFYNMLQNLNFGIDGFNLRIDGTFIGSNPDILVVGFIIFIHKKMFGIDGFIRFDDIFTGSNPGSLVVGFMVFFHKKTK